MANLSFKRPTSVMSLLADQMQSSCLNEISLVETSKSQSIDLPDVSKELCDISSSAPIHRYSIPGTCSSYLNLQSDLNVEKCCQLSNDSDLSSPQLPSKRLCHSSANDVIARPIPIKVNIKSDFNSIQGSSGHFDNGYRHTRMSFPRTNMTIKTPQRNASNFSIRPIISPHYKKSAFTPTRSLTSPQTTSSDYSISPDIESPIYRPASVTSSGFHDCSQQSLLIDPNYSPESNQKSSCETIINTKDSENRDCILPRCHSQPCDESVTKNVNGRAILIYNDKPCTCQQQSSKYQSQFHIPMKRRYPSLSHIRSTSQSVSYNVQSNDSPVHCNCNKRIPNSADTSPNTCGSYFNGPKRDGYFFGSGRSYLISLPRIASSPPPVSLQVDSQISTQGHRQRIGSNSSSLSTSTTTDANTPTVVYNATIQQKSTADSTSYNNNTDDVDMDDSFHENRSTITYKSDNFDSTPDKNPLRIWSDLSIVTSNNHPSFLCTSMSSCSVSTTSDMTTKSYSTNSDSTSNCTNISHSINSESSRSEFRDPDDPPDIGFCFSQLTDSAEAIAYEENSSFQELDLDQIELD